MFELDKIFPANNGIFVNTVKMRLVPETSALQFGGPTGATCTQILNGGDEGPPVFFANPRWHWRIRNLANGVGGLHDEIKDPAAPKLTTWYGSQTFDAGLLPTLFIPRLLAPGTFVFAPTTRSVNVETGEVMLKANWKFSSGPIVAKY